MPLRFLTNYRAWGTVKWFNDAKGYGFVSYQSGFHQRIRGKILINIFVGNLDPTTTEAQLKDLFAAYGSVETVTIVKDRDTNGPRGFAFVEMTNASEATAAIKSLNGFVLNDRAIRLNEARAKVERDSTGSLSREHRRHRI